MSDKQITPEQALILRIVEQWGNVVNMPKMEQWLKDYAASQPPSVKGEDKYELAFIPCAADDPRRIGAYQSTDGESEFSVRELHLPVEPNGSVWVKANERLPEKRIRVLASEGHIVWEAYIDFNGKWKWADVDNPAYRAIAYDPSLITHWMPLPSLPDESPTAAGEVSISRDWINSLLMEFALLYRDMEHKDIANDAADYLDQKLNSKGVRYILDENERLIAAGDGKEGQELLDWIYENDIIRTEDGTWERWDNGKALYRLFASGIDELYDIFKNRPQ